MEFTEASENIVETENEHDTTGGNEEHTDAIFCQYCEKAFSDFDEWKAHEEQEALDFQQSQSQEEELDFQQSEQNNLDGPNDTDMETIYCQYCEKSFTDFDEWRAHEEMEAKMVEQKANMQTMEITNSAGSGIKMENPNTFIDNSMDCEQQIQNSDSNQANKIIPESQSPSVATQLLQLKGIQFSAVKSQNKTPLNSNMNQENGSNSTKPIDFNLDKSKYSSNIYSDQQLNVLASNFEKNPYITKTAMDDISRQTGIPPKSITGWFQYQRNKQNIRTNPNNFSNNPNNSSKNPNNSSNNPNNPTNVSNNPRNISNNSSNIPNNSNNPRNYGNLNGRTVAQKLKSYELLKGQIDFLEQQISGLQKEVEVARKDLVSSLTSMNLNSSGNNSSLDSSANNSSLNSSANNSSLNSSGLNVSGLNSSSLNSSISSLNSSLNTSLINPMNSSTPRQNQNNPSIGPRQNQNNPSIGPRQNQNNPSITPRQNQNNPSVGPRQNQNNPPGPTNSMTPRQNNSSGPTNSMAPRQNQNTTSGPISINGMNGMVNNYPMPNPMFFNGYPPYYGNNFQQFPNYPQMMNNIPVVKQEPGQNGYFNPTVKQEPTFYE